jgi:hypothetical protein
VYQGDGVLTAAEKKGGALELACHFPEDVNGLGL